MFYCEENVDDFEKVVQFYEENLKIQTAFGLMPYKGKNYFGMNATDKKTYLTQRGQVAGMYYRNFMSVIEIDPPNLQNLFKSGESKPATVSEAMRFTINRLKSGMSGEKYVKYRYVIKDDTECQVYGFLESQTTESEKDEVVNMSVSTTNQSALEYDA